MLHQRATKVVKVKGKPKARVNSTLPLLHLGAAKAVAIGSNKNPVAAAESLTPGPEMYPAAAVTIGRHATVVTTGSGDNWQARNSGDNKWRAEPSSLLLASTEQCWTACCHEQSPLPSNRFSPNAELNGRLTRVNFSDGCRKITCCASTFGVPYSCCT